MTDPKRIYGWLDSQLSVARFYGGCVLNGVFYTIRYDLDGQPLEEIAATHRGKTKSKKAVPKPADKILDLFAELQREKQG